MVRIAAIERQVDHLLRDGPVPGIALAIVRDRQVVSARGFGVANVATGAPVTADTQFRIGSTTKPLTGTAIMRLVAAGQLQLDAPVTSYLPWFALRDPAAAGRVTLRQLLSHTAGLPSDTSNPRSRATAGLGAYLRTVVPQLPLVAPPGKVFCYSNAGFSVAGYIAEVVAGTPFPDLLQAAVFDPLGMSRTSFTPATDAAAGHQIASDGSLSPLPPLPDDAAFQPAGYAISTARDLARFALCQLATSAGPGDERPILAPTLAGMREHQVDRLRPDGAGYGLAWYTRPFAGQRMVSHGGELGLFRCRFALLPEIGAAVVLLANRGSPAIDAALGAITSTMLEQLLAPHQTVPDSAPARASGAATAWDRIVGSYLSPEHGLAVIDASMEQLTVTRHGERVALNSLRPDLYTSASGKTAVGIVPEAAGLIQYVMINGDPYRRFAPDSSGAPPATAVARYAGTYTAEVDGITERLRFRCEDGQLRLRLLHDPDGEDLPCWFLDANRVACDDGVFTFDLAPDGTTPIVHGYWASYERAPDATFATS